MRKPFAILPLVVAVTIAAPAAAAEPAHPKRDLSGGAHPVPVAGAIPVRPHLPPTRRDAGRSPDLGVTIGPAQSRAVKRAVTRAAKEQTFRDQHGHPIFVFTDNDAVDLRPFAEVIAATYHADELAKLQVFVTSSRRVEEVCGSEQAVACYGPDDESTGHGTMVISYQDDDIVHTVFHEYGHHIDNQLYNLSARIGCRFDNDGSRRWFFTRDVETRIFDNTSCSPDAGWPSLLGELYAEDYAQLSAAANGRRLAFDPRMPAGPPTGTILAALQRDIDRPFGPHTRKLRGSFRGKVARRRVTLDAPAFLRLTGASEVRRARVSGCATPYQDVYVGRCRITLTKKGRARRYRVGVEIY